MKFGDKLKLIRESIGLTQKEVADQCGLTKNNISHLECNRFAPRMDQYILICKAIRCEPDKFLKGVEF